MVEDIFVINGTESFQRSTYPQNIKVGGKKKEIASGKMKPRMVNERAPRE